VLRPALLLLAVALTACGNDSKTVTVKDDNGDNVEVTTTDTGNGATSVTATNDKGEKFTANMGGSDATWPADAPAFATAYPGASITTVMTSNTGGKAGSVIAFETGDAAAEVIDHYKALAAKAGLKQVTTMTAGAMSMFTASDETTGELLVQASTADGRTNGSITYSTKAG
jgi:hypothetical protein